jgi:hypothetical protein
MIVPVLIPSLGPVGGPLVTFVVVALVLLGAAAVARYFL